MESNKRLGDPQKAWREWQWTLFIYNGLDNLNTVYICWLFFTSKTSSVVVGCKVDARKSEVVLVLRLSGDVMMRRTWQDSPAQNTHIGLSMCREHYCHAVHLTVIFFSNFISVKWGRWRGRDEGEGDYTSRSLKGLQPFSVRQPSKTISSTTRGHSGCVCVCVTPPTGHPPALRLRHRGPMRQSPARVRWRISTGRPTGAGLFRQRRTVEITSVQNNFHSV